MNADRTGVVVLTDDALLDGTPPTVAIVGDVTIDLNGLITATGQGFGPNLGPGAGASSQKASSISSRL